MSETPDEIIERQGQMIVKQAEELQRMEARLALYDKYLGDTMQKTENAELRAEIERLKGMDQKGT